MYLSEMIDLVEAKTGEELFPSTEKRKADSPVEQITNIPKVENVEPPDDLPESTVEQEELE